MKLLKDVCVEPYRGHQLIKEVALAFFKDYIDTVEVRQDGFELRLREESVAFGVCSSGRVGGLYCAVSCSDDRSRAALMKLQCDFKSVTLGLPTISYITVCIITSAETPSSARRSHWSCEQASCRQSSRMSQSDRRSL